MDIRQHFESHASIPIALATAQSPNRVTAVRLESIKSQIHREILAQVDLRRMETISPEALRQKRPQMQMVFKRYCRQPTSGGSADYSQSRFITSVVQPENNKLRQRSGFFLFDSTPGNLQTVRAMDTYCFWIEVFPERPVRPFGERTHHIILKRKVRIEDG